MKAKKPESLREALPKRVTAFQRDAEKRLRKGLDQAIGMLPPVPRKAVKQLTANVDRARHDLRKRGEKMLAEVRKRTEHLAANVEKRIEDAVKPLTGRFDVASRAEVERLRKRLEHLERRVETHGHQHTTTTSATA